jgi:chemotaxis protein MotB
MLGCAQNRTTNPYAAPSNALGNAPAIDPYSATAPQGRFSQALQSLRPQNRLNIADLHRRAQEQERLAAEQQRELERLRDIQRRYDALVDSLQTREEQEVAANQQQLAQRGQEWESRAKSAIGRYQELNDRAKGLDQDNRDLQARMARSQQQYELLRQQNELLRRRLAETVDQLSQAQGSAEQSAEQLRTLQASARRRGGAQITANNSLRSTLTAVTVQGLEVRQDGELVRIVMPTDQLFVPGTATLTAGAQSLIDQVADVLLRNYSNQIIGVEAHSDNSGLDGTLWRNSHQLTAAQAMAVFEQLSYRHRLLPQQLFVLGHGSNYPLVSNGTQAGQSRNRRVEVVIYPETVDSRR